MPYSLLDHLSYTVWANERVAEMAMPLDEALLHKEIKSSFPSLAKTLIHMRDAEILWLSRLKGETIPWPRGATPEGKPELLASLVQTSRDVLDYVASQGPGYASTRIKYRNTKGEPFENPAKELLMHLVNHGTYHRGQLITMLRGLGVSQIKSTDLIQFIRSRNK